MSMPDSRSKYKRTNLFLFRVWCDDADQNENRNGDEGERSGLVWHGMVQRTVTGEAHSFDGKEGLLEVLEAMLCKDPKDRPQHTRPGPQGKTISKQSLAATGNHNQAEANEGNKGNKGNEGTR